MEKISNIIAPSPRKVWQTNETPKPKVTSTIDWDTVKGVGSQYGPSIPVGMPDDTMDDTADEVLGEDPSRGQILDTHA